MKIRKKTNLAIWTKAFPAQAKKLRPENTIAGGVKARSGSEAMRMEVYRGIAEMFKRDRPVCEICPRIFNRCAFRTEDVHHVKGRDGLLLFHTKYFVAVCRGCHAWIHDNPKVAALIYKNYQP